MASKPGQLQDGIHEVHVVLVVLPGGRFIHDQDARLHGEDGRDAYTLLLAERQSQRWVLLLLGKVHNLERLFHLLFNLDPLDASDSSARMPAPHAPSAQTACGWDFGRRNRACWQSEPRWPPLYRGRRRTRVHGFGFSKPMACLTKVVLPAPFGPSTAMTSPRRDLEIDSMQDFDAGIVAESHIFKPNQGRSGPF